jgi:hypothetical protein
LSEGYDEAVAFSSAAAPAAECPEPRPRERDPPALVDRTIDYLITRAAEEQQNYAQPFARSEMAELELFA